MTSSVLRLLLALPWVGPLSMIAAFPGHTYFSTHRLLMDLQSNFVLKPEFFILVDLRDFFFRSRVRGGGGGGGGGGGQKK